MSKTEQRHRAATAHGEVEYATVTCSSCENEVPKDTAKRMLIGDVVGHRDWSTFGKEDYELSKDGLRKGWACEYCREDPAGVPSAKLNIGIEELTIALAMAGVSLSLLAPLTFAIGQLLVEMIPFL